MAEVQFDTLLGPCVPPILMHPCVVAFTTVLDISRARALVSVALIYAVYTHACMRSFDLYMGYDSKKTISYEYRVSC